MIYDNTTFDLFLISYDEAIVRFLVRMSTLLDTIRSGEEPLGIESGIQFRRSGSYCNSRSKALVHIHHGPKVLG